MSLTSKTILITRIRNQAKGLVEMLENLGYNVLNIPTIQITDPDDPAHIQKLLKDTSSFEWIIFTSANAVRYFFKFCSGNDQEFRNLKIACIGNKTAEVLESFSIEPQLIPGTFSNQGLLNDIQKYEIRGKHILLPVSNIAGDELHTGLEALGAHVKRIEVYKNEPYKDSQWDTVYEKLENNIINCIAFYSPSALYAFTALIGDKGIAMINDKKIAIAVIGSSTARAAREKQLHPQIMPLQSDDKHFVEALEGYLGL